MAENHTGTSQAPLIRLRNVSKTYPTKGKSAPLTAVDNVSIDVQAGDILGIVGYSGAGKSTLVRLINALEPASDGNVEIDGVDITALSSAKQRELRQHIGMIFQRFNLLQSRTVVRNVEYPLEVAGAAKAERRARALELLEYVGLADKANSYPEQLSGGQQQRVGIARALAGNPKILLADEATSALDPDTTVEVLDLLAKVNRDLGITIILITHEMDVVARIANRVAVMEAGQIVETGNVYDIFTAPEKDVTKRFVATVVRSLPTGEALESLRASHPQAALYEVRFGDAHGAQKALFGALNSAGIEFEILHGGTDDIQGRIYGRLLLALQGNRAEMQRVFAELAGTVEAQEV